ncbi:MAG: FtsX-like permease family protein [Actinobacteria bacterium]|nr:FtsX-like permease family protein [Actinomycetota bacterium]
MATVWLALCADARRRWRVLLSLTVILGVAGGLVLTAAAGARRTDTAYQRLLSWANAAQLEAIPGNPDPRYFAALARLPQVAAMSSAIQYNLALPAGRGEPDTQLTALASPDNTLGVSVDRVKITDGAMFDPGAANQVVIDPRLASMEHVRPGGLLRLTAIPYNGFAQGAVPDLGLAFPLYFRVSGIAVFDDQVVPATATNAQPRVLLTPAFSRTGAANSIIYMAQAGLRLRPGTDPGSFAVRARALAARSPQASFTAIVNLADEFAVTQRAISPQAVALAVFAGLAGLISLAVLGQLLARQLALDSAEFPILRAVGMTRRSLLALAMARLAVVTVAGAALAVAIAVAASPLMPIGGSARLAEPHPGAEVNVSVLAAGYAVIAVVPLALLMWPARRAVSHALGPLGVAEPAAGRARTSVLASALTAHGPVTSALGVRMAFEPGRGRTAVPVRSALTGSVIALAALVAAAVFGASLAGLVGTPHRYGDNWNAELNLGFAAASGPFAAARVLSAAPEITGYAAGDTGQLTIDGTSVPAIGIDQVRGSGYLTLISGRAPASANEIVLGAQTLAAIGARLGQTVRVAISFSTGIAGVGRPRPMRVVGTAIFPDFGLPGLSDTDLGTGALVVTSLLSEDSMPQTGCVNHVTCYNFFLLRYRPGTGASAVAGRLLAATTRAGCPASSCTVIENQRPGDIKNYAAIRDTPLVLAAVLAVLAAGTLAHVLLTGVRRRRRDLAVLKTLGCTRSQVHSMVAWEASALAAAALLAGIPLGVIAGRLAWAIFAGAVGVASQATIEMPLLLLAVPVTLLLANVIAAWPGRTAARLRPAAVLRAE